MNTKKERREAAQKRARKKRITIVAVCAAFLAVAVTIAIVYASTRPDNRADDTADFAQFFDFATRYDAPVDEIADYVQYENEYYEYAVLDTEYQVIEIDGEYIIVLTEQGFSEQIKQIQWNADNYFGRIIRFEGSFSSWEWEDETIYIVTRDEGAACCGLHGFEVYLNEFPPFDDETWVEVTGIFEEFYVDGAGPFRRLNVIDLIEG